MCICDCICGYLSTDRYTQRHIHDTETGIDIHTYRDKDRDRERFDILISIYKWMPPQTGVRRSELTEDCLVDSIQKTVS